MSDDLREYIVTARLCLMAPSGAEAEERVSTALQGLDVDHDVEAELADDDGEEDTLS
jgi:hypothetical protein